MTACGTGLITESSTIILVPEKNGMGKEQLSICTDATGCLKETVGRVGKNVSPGVLCAHIVIVTDEPPRNTCI